jgi:hypothetical protein
MRMPRSTRWTGRPAPRSSSVALLAHGDKRAQTRHHEARDRARPAASAAVAGLQDAAQRRQVGRWHRRSGSIQ